MQFDQLKSDLCADEFAFMYLLLFHCLVHSSTKWIIDAAYIHARIRPKNKTKKSYAACNGKIACSNPMHCVLYGVIFMSSKQTQNMQSVRHIT